MGDLAMRLRAALDLVLRPFGLLKSHCLVAEH